MKNVLFFLLIFSFISCKKDVEIQRRNCSNPIDLGGFPLSETAREVFPYNGYWFNTLSDKDRSNQITISINQPDFINASSFQQVTKISNCEENDYVNQFFLNTEEKHTYFWIKNLSYLEEFQNKSPSFLMIVKPIFIETAEEVRKTSESLFIYSHDAFGFFDEFKIYKTPIISIPISIIDDTVEIDDYGYDFHKSITLNGIEYQNIYTNSIPLTSEQGLYLTDIFFSLKNGVIGVKDTNEKIWLTD